MGRRLIVIWAGRRRRDAWGDLCGRYRRRIRRFVEVSELAVRSKKAANDPGRLEDEGRALLAAAPAGSWTVALDRRGRQRDSEELARWLARRLESTARPVAFLIGSDLGLAPGVRRGCRERLSLGPLTLPHELARLVLYEQIYRSLTLRAGIKYHRGPL